MTRIAAYEPSTRRVPGDGRKRSADTRIILISFSVGSSFGFTLGLKTWTIRRASRARACGWVFSPSNNAGRWTDRQKGGGAIECLSGEFE